MVEDNLQGGYFQARDGMDFFTIHGTGHMAPQWAREEVPSMVNGFMYDEDY